VRAGEGRAAFFVNGKEYGEKRMMRVMNEEEFLKQSWSSARKPGTFLG
jgi:hypothetical protein